MQFWRNLGAQVHTTWCGKSLPSHKKRDMQSMSLSQWSVVNPNGSWLFCPLQSFYEDIQNLSPSTKSDTSCNQQRKPLKISHPPASETQQTSSNHWFSELNPATFRLGRIYHCYFLFGITFPICFIASPQKSETRIDHHKARDPKEMQQQFHWLLGFGGWTNPFEKYAQVKLDHFPKDRAEN